MYATSRFFPDHANDMYSINFSISIQENEIDLEALLLMTEQDYADIGLPKVCISVFLVST